MSTRSAGTGSEFSKEKLVHDLRMVVTDAEELLRATAGVANDKVSAVRGRIQENLEVTKERLNAAEEALLAKTKQAAIATDEYVQENPWRAVGISAGVGLIVGLLITRGR